MGAVDRTLLASLGFADADKKSGLHWKACQYLAQPAQVAALVRKIWFEDTTDSYSARVEVLVSKGGGQYKQSIGFIDVLLEWESCGDEYRTPMTLGIEVKATDKAIDAAIRQINLYREYTGYDFVLATCFPVPQHEVDLLDSNGILHIHLGDRFAVWVAAMPTETATTSLEL